MALRARGIEPPYLHIMTPRKKIKEKVGRKTVFNTANLQKLEEAFSLGAKNSDACAHADISEAAFYAFCKDNPQKKERFERLKAKPILKALNTLNRGLQENPELALKYLERKRKDEYSTQTETVVREGVPKIIDDVE